MGCGCNKTPCTCGPVPYYTKIKMCPEDNKEYILEQRVSASIKVSNSWNIPVCGGTAVLFIPGLNDASLGSFIWNKNFGYFEITGVDLNQLEVTNTCLVGNSVSGTQVPECTDFIITDPPSDLINNSGVYVAYDFTAPANNACIDITVTSVNGLVEGNEVQIGSGIYFLNAVNSNNVINICNYDNKGITPGTPVVAKNAGGSYQYPVTVISVNPCSQDPIYEGRLVVCDSKVQKVLTGNTDGQFLTLLDHTTGDAGFTDGPCAGSLITTGGTLVVCDGAALKKYNGASNGQVLSLVNNVTGEVKFIDQTATSNWFFASTNAPGTLSCTGTNPQTSNVASLSFVNGYSSRNGSVLVNIIGDIYGLSDALASAQFYHLVGELQVNFNGGGYSTVATVTQDIFDGALSHGFQVCKNLSFTIPASSTITVDAKLVLTMGPCVAGDSFDLVTFQVTLNALSII